MTMDDLVQAIANAETSKFEHRQYIEGILYVTPRQFEGLKQLGQRREAENDFWLSPKSAVDELNHIPVVVVNNKPIILPSGKVLIYSAILDALYLFDPSIARDAGLLP